MKRKKTLARLDWLDANPDKHVQSHWTNISGYYDDNDDWADFKEKTEVGEVINCGTNACLAGWISFEEAPVGTKFYESRLLLPPDEGGQQYGKIPYSNYAAHSYGFTLAEANYLFDGSRSRASQRKLVMMGKKRRREFLKSTYGYNWEYNQEGLDRLLDTKVQLTDGL